MAPRRTAADAPAHSAVSGELAQLAALHGIELEYENIESRMVAATPEALVEVLRALGVEVESPEQAGQALERERARLAERVLDAVHVAWDGELPELRLGEAFSGELAGVLTLEDGSERPVVVRARGGRGAIEGLDGALPHGYHRLDVSARSKGRSRGQNAGTLLISAPRTVHAGPRGGEQTWGVFVPVYALRSGDGGWGVGDLGDLDRLLGIVEERGGAFAGSTPLLASFLDEPFQPSPYSPVSRLFWNELFVDLAAVPEVRRSSAATKLLGSKAFEAERAQLAAGELVDYRATAALKRRVLELGAAELAGERLAAFERFRERTPRLGDYAAFRAATERRGESWWCWDEPQRSGTLTAEDYDQDVARYHEYAQFVMDDQLAHLAATRSAELYLDLPVGVSSDGYDMWRERDLFAPGISVGAPPDPLGPLGQDWGLPPLHPETIRERGYGYVIDSMRHLFRHAGAVRIDHVMGLHRLFWIPHTLTAADGVYVRYAAEELWAIVCLESHRSGALVVGEDLGTVPPGTRAAMESHEARRSYVLQFELGDPGRGEPAVKAPVSCSLASVNTHDTPTFASFWRGQDDAVRARVAASLGAADPDDPAVVLDAALRHLGASDAEVVIASLEDLWLETEPQNVPGTTDDEQPNWRRRIAHTLDELAASPARLAPLDALHAARSPRTPGGDSTMPRTSTKARPARNGSSADAPRPAVPATSLIGDQDLHFFAEGTHGELHKRLGAHVVERDGVTGTNFAVWAPNAEAVSVIGDFNGWNRDATPLTPRASSGIWEGFVPAVGKGEVYKYHVRSRFGGYSVDKADPFAVYAEVPPKTGSVVWPLDYEWNDAEWMQVRKERNALDAPMSVYEVHIGSWRRDPDDPERLLSYREVADQLADYCTELGFTHVELLPVMEHPFYGSWGYQTTGYFAPSSRYGTPQDFKYFVDRLHRSGIGVILDWVPSHFPTDEHGLAYFDGTHLFEHSDPRQGFHPDWKSAIFNYGRNEVRSFLLSSARYWIEEYHVDGLRVDAVASMLYLDYSREDGEWIPNEHGGRENLEAISFLRRLNEDVYTHHPDVQTIAEESTAWGGVSRPTYLGGLGFGMKWDMGWMHDTLQYFGHEPVHRRYHQNELTFRAIYAFTENFMLPLSHDEVVHGKGSLIRRMPGDDWQRFANLRLLLSYMFTQPGKKLLFMGGEFGQHDEWKHEGSLDWHLLDFEPHQGLKRLVSDLNRLHRERPELHQRDLVHEGFQWVDAADAETSVLSYLRVDADGNPLLCVFNGTPVVRENYRVGVPLRGRWTEVFNSDAHEYGGSGVGNWGGVDTSPVPIHGREWSINVTLPPLSMLLLVPEGGR